ncbi:MAG: arabinogalactan endo-1,4-beta-galactosidase [Bacteroidales bacterium]|nr:arabinogalactan endo-1,4-beta-galactosidase [Bacteroidales bacterium]
MKRSHFPVWFLLACLFLLLSCKDNADHPKDDAIRCYTYDQFCMGVDLSYVNQLEDFGAVYKDSGKVNDPYRIFRNHGANLVRLRLWHNPSWVRQQVYKSDTVPLYSGLNDVKKSIRRAKNLGFAICLDFHYSDIWADPTRQTPPTAWAAIRDFAVLKDSFYTYTYSTLHNLAAEGLLPEMVQLGNEINCGLFYTDIEQGFPSVNCCEGKWVQLGELLNEAIRAVRKVSSEEGRQIQIGLHIADPKNVQWWFEQITSNGKVTDFDIIGISYYPLWHTTVSFDNLGVVIRNLKNTFGKKIMIFETAYPWTTEYADNYANAFGNQSPLPGFPFTATGQYNFMVSLCQKVINGGGSGVIYWEPAWITSRMKDLWGTGSIWENATMFDFEGNTLPSINYLNASYKGL